MTALERNEIKRQYHFQKLHLKSELHFEVFDPSLDSSVALVFMLCNTLKRGGGKLPLQFLADQLTLIEPGGHIMSTALYLLPSPQILYGAASLLY